MSDNEVILYEITDEPVDSPVQEPMNKEQTRPREKKLKQSRIGDLFSKNNSSCRYNANKISLYETGVISMHLRAFMTVLVRVLAFKKWNSH